MRVAVLGAGKMGSAVARRLHAVGHEVSVWNRTAERARAVGVGRVAATPEEAASAAEAVFSVLFGPDSVREVYGRLGPARGQVFADMTTGGPEVLDELAPRLEAAGAELLATPILGNPNTVAAGGALVLVGGHPAAFERLRPALEAIGQPELLGSRRDASGLKLIANAMLGACSAVTAELLATAGRAGLDPEATFKLLARTMPYIEARRRSYLEGVHQPAMFELSGMVKDLSLALDLGHRAGAAMPLTAVARETYAAAEPAHGGQEMTAVIERYRT
jgi:3-hydroxyisobutyrate dehydrogenase